MTAAPTGDLLRLSLLVPGLTGIAGGGMPHEAARYPALETLLARAQRRHLPGAEGFEATLFRLLAAAIPETGDLPVAAVTRALDLGVIDRDWWLRADPVHLVPDRDRLVLTDASRLNITHDEASALIGEIAEIYKGEGWLFRAPHPDRWYAKPPRAPQITTTALAAVVGRDIHPYLPQGAEAKAWHTVLTEIQILLHSSKTNEARERAGKPAINSLWFWGGGGLPRIDDKPFAVVWSTEPISLGLARLTQTTCAPVPASFGEWHAAARVGGSQLVVLDGGRAALDYSDPLEWREVMETLERDWFEPLLAALQQRRLAEVQIVSEAGAVFALTPRRARRWWRWRRPLASHR